MRDFAILCIKTRRYRAGAGAESRPTVNYFANPSLFGHSPIALTMMSRRRFSCAISSSMKRRKLLGNAARAFDAGMGLDAETAREREVEKLHAKIGQLTVERDFLARRSGR